MCGIAGIYGGNIDLGRMDKMLDIQKHRGPDNASKWHDDSICLGHNRLSIIDLSEEANQPFVSNDNRYILVFNGEIYNYLELKIELEQHYNFKTNSDTEVLIAAFLHWGKDCLPKLNGMFAFAIWDTQKKSLFAARDRFGVKPLYYNFSKGVFTFASEIKTIHTSGIPKIPNESVWASYFAYGSYGVMLNETFWEGIHQLPGSHFMTVIDGVISIKKWYFFEDEVKKYSRNENYETVKSNYTKLLEDSIKLRFRADVKVGFNVSGGVDSSTLLAFVNKMYGENNIEAYTFYTNDEYYDELYWVENMIETTSSPLTKVLTTAETVISSSKALSFYQDEPFGGIPTIAYNKIFETARANGTLVLLDGQGMDEQWAGYDYYNKNNNAIIQGVNKSPFRPNVLKEDFLKKAIKPIYPKPFNDKILDMQFRDLFYTKIPRALRFNDRVSMANSTELREPFLDYRLVEYAFAQPIDFKIKNGVQKYMLRDIVGEYLSDTISYAPKRPLQTPQREWLANELKDEVSTIIDSIKDSNFKHWFNLEKLENEWQQYINGDQESSFHIWQWLSYIQLIN